MDAIVVGNEIMRAVPLLRALAARLPLQVIVNQASGFPWSNLITAVATVAAGLGAVMPTQRDAQRRFATKQAADHIQGAYVAVLLVGSARARDKAEAVRQATWKLSDRVRPVGGQNAAVVPSFDQLKPLAYEFRADKGTFIEAATQELRGRLIEHGDRKTQSVQQRALS